MPESPLLTREEGEYLAREYQAIAADAQPMRRFLSEVYRTLGSCGLTAQDSVLDVGCGRGYLLQHLAQQGHTALRGIDPCQELLRDRLSPVVGPGAFFDSSVEEVSFDVVTTCHTLHHLRESDPVEHIRWLAQRARKFVAIVEINNTNLPMLFVSLLHRRVEANAFRYNRGKVEAMCRRAGLTVLHSADMAAGYISGDSFPHRLSARIGCRPYNIVVARA